MDDIQSQYQIVALKLHDWGLFIMYTNFQSKKCWLFHFEGAMIDHHHVIQLEGYNLDFYWKK